MTIYHLTIYNKLVHTKNGKTNGWVDDHVLKDCHF